MSQHLKILILVCAVVIVSGCSLRGDNPQSPQTQNNEQKAVAIEQVALGELDVWQTLARESEGFSIRFPNGWWWQRDNGLQDELDASFAVGFALSQSERDAQNYEVVFFIADEDEDSQFDGYQKIIAVADGTQYALRGKPEYIDIINAMADSFEFLAEDINPQDLFANEQNLQTYHNDEWSIEFQYPRSYEVISKRVANWDNYEGKAEDILYIEHKTMKPHSYGNIIRLSDKDIPELIQELKELYPLIRNIKQENIMIGGRQGIKLTYDPGEGQLPEQNLRIYTRRGDKTYILERGFGIYFNDIINSVAFIE